MKKDFTQTIKNMDGTDAKIENGKPFTYAMAISIALLQPQDQLSGEEKYLRFKLAGKIEKSDANYSTEELAKIKEAVGKAHNPIVVGRVWDFIENKNK